MLSGDELLTGKCATAFRHHVPDKVVRTWDITGNDDDSLSFTEGSESRLSETELAPNGSTDRREEIEMDEEKKPGKLYHALRHLLIGIAIQVYIRKPENLARLLNIF